MGTLRHAIPTWAATCIIYSLLSVGVLPAARARGRIDLGPGAPWPRTFVAPNGATITINHPQIAEWPNESAVTFYAAVSYLPKDASRAALGTVAVEADTQVSFGERLVRFSKFAVVDANFPTLKKPEVGEIVSLIEQRLPPQGRTVTLDAVLAAVDKRPVAARNAVGLKADPPTVLVTTKPALVVNIDGAPVWAPWPAPHLSYVMNTTWDLIRDTESGKYFLRDDRMWLTAPNVLGPWTRAENPPRGLDQLPAGGRWSGARASLSDSHGARRPPARVFVSRQPAELIVLNGDAAYRQVPGTSKLMWVRNTDSDVFREGTNGTVYYLVSGRWFAAPDFNGPWTFATHTLPQDFRKIPLNHPRSHVLASVPGTPQAADAVRLAHVSHSERVNKRATKAPSVLYDGAPNFQLISGTPILRAVNTEKDVFKAGHAYYLCSDAMWFTAPAATGPWKVTGVIPAAIYRIPASSPAYHVTYVTASEDTEDWTVFSTAPGYTGTLIGANTVVWGTGYNYAPYIGGTAARPIYIGEQATYGVGAWYNPWAAAFGRGRAGYGASGAAPLSARLFRDAGPTAAAPVGTSGELNGQLQMKASTQPATGGVAVFAGRDGNVYRHRANGWDKYQNGTWAALRPTSAETAILRQLDDDARARTAAAERARTAKGLQTEWGPRAASYRPGAASRSTQ
jgi:hypothetical protein